MIYAPLRGLTREALLESANVLTATVTSDAGGGGSVTFAAGGTIPCRIDLLSGSEDELADRISDRSSHLVTLPAQTSISPASLLRINGRGTFEVTATRTDSGEHARFVEVVRR